MKIAQVSPLYESVPPKMYGGTERVVSYLTEELVKQGHEVTLFASGDSLTQARLIAPCERALRLDSTCVDQFAHHMLMLEMVQQAREDFDLIHYHIDYIHFPLTRLNKSPNLTTLHGRLNIPDLKLLYREFDEMPVVSISDSQRMPLPEANWVGTVYHGLPVELMEFNENGGEYLAFLGRISPEKGVESAIEIATRCGIPLKIAAKIDKADSEYFETQVKHLMDNPLIEFVGEINDAEKSVFLGNAMALLFPINWPEPFGLVMIEAMGCGTPVVAFGHGSVPEIIDEGVSGFIVDTVEEAVEVVCDKISSFDRNACRAVFEKRFSAKRMAKDYAKIYRREIELWNRGKFDILKAGVI